MRGKKPEISAPPLEFELLTRKAESGDRDAQFAVGQAFDKGAEGVKAYRPSAIAWYFKAANQGHVEAQAGLGALFLAEAEAKDSASNAEKARTWLTKAATQGNPKAMYDLGLLLRHGYGTERKSKAAYGWFEAASNQGHHQALNQLGELALENAEQAAAAGFFRQGAERGDARAQCNLGRCFADGIGVTRDPVQAVRWFVAAAEQDLAEAQYRLGMMFLDSKTGTQDFKQAQRWFQQAATRGDANAQYEAAEGFRSGRGTKADFGRAIAFYRMAADQGHVKAQYGLGAMFESGAGLREPKLGDAAIMYRRAAIGGHATAAHNYGIMLTRGIGVAADKKRAREVIEYAIGLGRDEAMVSLAYLLMSEGDLVGAAQWTFLVLQHEPEGQGQKLLDLLKSRLPVEALIDAEKRATRWRRKPIEIDWS
jgi:TPR repeat protein